MSRAHITKEDVINEILKLTGGDTKKEFSKGELAMIFGVYKNQKVLDPIIDELTKEGFIKLSRVKGNTKYYILAKGEKGMEKEERAVSDTTDVKRIINAIMKDPSFRQMLRDLIKEILEKDFNMKDVTISDLERIYEIAMDGLCMASIYELRTMLGLTLEEFMAKFRDYILKNYDLISGGKEGFIKDGVIYGIIRKKEYTRNCPKYKGL